MIRAIAYLMIPFQFKGRIKCWRVPENHIQMIHGGYSQSFLQLIQVSARMKFIILNSMFPLEGTVMHGIVVDVAFNGWPECIKHFG